MHTSPDPFAEVAGSSLWDQDRDYEQEPQDYWLGLPHMCLPSFYLMLPDIFFFSIHFMQMHTGEGK